MRRSIRGFIIPPPPPPRAFELWKIGSFIFPTFWAKIAFKCSTQANVLLKVFICLWSMNVVESSKVTYEFPVLLLGDSLECIKLHLLFTLVELNQNWLKISEKEHHERHAARDPRHFFLWMFFLHTLRWLRQLLCHNENWNKTCARSGVTFTWSRHTTLWIGCVAWPD